MPEDSAKRLAASCDKLAAGLQSEIRASQVLTRVTGFPDLPSGRGLSQGFGAKGYEYVETLTSFQEVALRYKAVFLIAGKQFAEADAATRQAIKVATQKLEGGK
ncbi:hypothetical protein NRB20_04910 [Nocardia sp. RB20]|uniref:Uncharacterized protein n=2 Tax=Nocardia macrotermitis TaxID=2585198 RepID=A0A7K0CVB4_9NOCA|nr:hypothetical protein [Nocardia macrotermitis]